MSRHEHKARGKVTQKLTRDGLVERNAATGEEERLSTRSADFDIRGAISDDHALSQAGTRADDLPSPKLRNRAAYSHAREQEAMPQSAAGGVNTEPAIGADAPGHDKSAPLRQENVIHDLPPGIVTAPTGKRQDYNNPQSRNLDMEIADIAGDSAETARPKLSTARESKLQTDGNSPLRFSRNEAPPQEKARRGLNRRDNAEQTVAESVTSPPSTPLAHDESDMPDSTGMNVYAPTTLRFDKAEKGSIPIVAATVNTAPAKPKRQQNTPQQAVNDINGDGTTVSQKPPELISGTATPTSDSGATPTTAQSPLKEPETALKPAKGSKLRFKPEDTPPEMAKPGRKLAQAQAQADKAAGKLEQAQSKLPAKKKLRTKIVSADESGKPKRKLIFESEAKPMGEHIKGAKPLRPIKAAANSALMFGHGKMFQVERENVAVEAAHRSEMAAEGVARASLRHHKTAPYRKVEKLQRKAAKKSVNLAYQKTLAENPKLKGNALSRAFQKRKIKRDYAKAVRETQKAAQRAKKAGTATAKAVRAIAGFVRRHPIAAIIVILVLLLLFSLMSLIGVFGSLGSGGVASIAAGTYLAEDADILGAQAAYAGMEAELQSSLDNYETLNPGYDEYVYDLDDIWHDPYVLTAILSALHEGAWTLDDVQGTLAALFEQQYILTETTTVETRTRTETGTQTDPVTGETSEYDYEVTYNYYIRTVTLENFNLSHLPIYIMGESGLSRYALFMMTLGNRPDLFPVASFPNASYYRDYGRHDIPQAYLDADPIFAAIITEAEKWLGMPYVWGGYSPVTSFDCSGYVSWVLNQSGWNIGRLGAQGLYNISTPVAATDAKPGDLVFFHSTYDAPGVTHVGIYVGDGMMVHAGNPIGYVSLNTSYWQAHLFAYGKLY